MATKNLVPRGDLEGKLGIHNRRWKEINAGEGQFNLLKTNELQNTLGQPLFVSGNSNMSIDRSDNGSGFQYVFTSAGGGGTTVSDKIFEGTLPLQNVVETINEAGVSKIKFTIGGSPDTGWEIDENGHMLPYDNDRNNIGNVSKQVKEVFLMNDALTFESGKINVSNSKRLQFGTPVGNSYIYDDISLTKSSVKVATTAEFSNWTYDATNGLLFSPSPSYMGDIDSEVIVNDDRILVKDQTNKTENGIYKVLNKGDAGNTAQLKRVDDLLIGADFIGINVSVLEGTDNKQKLFFVTPPASGGSIVGTHHQNWMTFGEGLDVAGVRSTVGSMFNPGGGISFSFDTGTGKLTPALSLALNNLSDVDVGTPDATDDDKVLQWNWDATAGTGEFGLATVTSGGTPRSDEDIQDVAGGLLVAGPHTGISFSYNTTTNVLTSSVSDVFVKKNATTTFGSDSTTPTYDFHAKSVVVKVPTPTANEHAVNKQYVDAAMQGINEILTPVKAASTGSSLDLSIDLVSGSTIDTVVSLSVGDRVLVKDQTTASENGVYVVGVTGVGGGNNPTVRATDLAAGSRAHAKFIYVKEGTDNKGSGFICITPAGGTNPDKSDWTDEVGADDLEFAQFSSAGEISDGTALDLTAAGTLNVKHDNLTITLDTEGKLQVGSIGFDRINGDLPADKLPDTVLTTTSTITATSITASGITGIHSMSGFITDLEDTDGFIINDSSHTDANGNATSDQVKRGAAGRILEYVQGRFIGDISVSKYIDNTDSGKIKLDVSLNSNAFTTKDFLSDTNTDSTDAAYEDDNKLQPDDLFLISDSSESDFIRKVKFSDISAAALDIVGLDDQDDSLAPLSDDDFLAIYENTSSSNRKVTISQIKGAVSSGLQYKELKLTSHSNLHITGEANTHYHIKQSSSYEGEFIFDFNNTPGEDGDIIKISMTNFNKQYITPSEDLLDIWSANDNIVKIKTLGLTNESVLLSSNASQMSLVYNCRDFNKPLEFICEKVTGGPDQWWPSIEKSRTPSLFFTSNSTINAHMGSNHKDFWTRFTTVFITEEDETQLYTLPSANKVASDYGVKPGDSWTWFFTDSVVKRVSFTSGGDDIAVRGAKSETNQGKQPKYLNNIDVNFGTNNTLKKINLTINRVMRSSTPAGTYYHDYFWIIEHFVDVAEAIDLSNAQDGQVVGVTVNSPAEFSVDFIKNKNIGVGQIKGLNPSTLALPTDSTSKIALETITGGTSDTDDRGNIALNTISTENLKKIENKKVLGSLLNTGASSGETNPVTSINIIDDLTTFISSDTSKHTNLVTATAVKNFFRDSSQTAGFPNVRSVYATMNTSDIMTVGDTGNTTSVASGSNTIVGTVQLTIDDVETGVVLRKHDTAGFDSANANNANFPVSGAKFAFKGDLTPSIGTPRSNFNNMMGNNTSNYLRYDAGTITDPTIFSYYVFKNCYRIQLPPAETFFNKYGTTESFVLQMEGDFAPGKAVGMVILPHPDSLGNSLIGTKALTHNFTENSHPFVFIDSYQNGKYVFTNEANYFFVKKSYSSSTPTIEWTHMTVSIGMSLKTNVPLGTCKSSADNPEILGYVPSAYVWTIRIIDPIEM